MPKKTLNDRMLKALKPAKKGTRYEIMDAVVPGLGVRVTDKGTRTFVFIARYPGNGSSARRALDEYGGLTLTAARERARKWIDLLGQGIDPSIEEERIKTANLVKQERTVSAVAADFIEEKLSQERRGREAKREMERDVLPILGPLPIADVTAAHIVPIIKSKKNRSLKKGKKGAPVQAINLLALMKRFFEWAIDQQQYGLAQNPCEKLKPKKLIGKRPRRSRVLTDDEIRALWRATRPGRLGSPYGEAYRVLLLAALRLNEAADATWSELDFRNKIWVIPPERMSSKGRDATPRAHAIPLSGKLCETLGALPKSGSDYLFTTARSETSAWMSDKAKKRLDARMLRTLRAIARTRGENPSKVQLNKWVNHDIRRTVRTRLSRLKITEEAREAVLAHAKSAIKDTYDLHDYLEEKREALQLWADALMKIVEPTPPTPSNVVPIAQARA